MLGSKIIHNAVKILGYLIDNDAMSGNNIKLQDIFDFLGLLEKEFDSADTYLLQQRYVEGTMGGMTGNRWLTARGVDFYEENKSILKTETNIQEVTHMPDAKKVFVVHGRDIRLRDDFFSFLRALSLQPIEWSEALKLTGKATPYIGEAIESAFNNAQAVIVLLSPDDEVRLSPHLWMDNEEESEKQVRLQARPNVLFEAGMAFGIHPERTILVKIGQVKEFSDVAGRHVVKLSNLPHERNDIAQRLRTAGCDVSTSGSDWLSTGNFEVVREIENDSNHMYAQAEKNKTSLKNIENCAFDEAYKHLTNQLSYAIGRYKAYVSNLAPEKGKYTEVGVWERINEVKSARLQLLSVCGEHVRSILLEAGTDWLDDIHLFGKTAPSIMEKLSEIAFKDRG